MKSDNTVKNPVKSGEEIMFGSELSGDADVIESKPGTELFMETVMKTESP
mgnify:CR=1 FL=1